MISPETIKAVLSRWDLFLKVIRSDCDLQGSQERTLFRTAVEDEAGRLFVVGQIAPDRRERKQLISTILNDLHADGLKQVVPYLTTPAGQSLVFCEGGLVADFPFCRGDAPRSAPVSPRRRKGRGHGTVSLRPLTARAASFPWPNHALFLTEGLYPQA